MKKLATIAIATTTALGLSACGDSHADEKPVNGYNLRWERIIDSIYTACDAKHGNRIYQDTSKGDIAAIKDDSCKG